MNGGRAIQQVLREALETNPRVHILGEALELSPATHGLLEAFPERVHLLPAVDSALAGIAIGIALGGSEAIVELAGPASLYGALQQLTQEAASGQGEFRTPIVVRVPIAPGEEIPLGLLLGTPGITVAVASSANETRDLLRAALRSTTPVVLLEPRWLMERSVSESDPLPLGRARIVREGPHCSLLCWGQGVHEAHRAADRLATEGIGAEIIDLRCLQPLDTELLSDQIRRTGRPILVDPIPGLFEAVLDSAFLRLESPPMNCEPRSDSIVETARQSVSY